MNRFKRYIYDTTMAICGHNLVNGIHWGLFKPDAIDDWKDYLVLTPFGVAELVESSGMTTIETHGIRFQVYTNSLATSGEYVESLFTGFYKHTVALGDNSYIIDARKVDDTVELVPERWVDGSEIWLGVLGMAFTVQRAVVQN